MHVLPHKLRHSALLDLQNLVAINLSISDKTLASKPVLVDAFTAAKSKTGRLHFLGLVSHLRQLHGLSLLINKAMFEFQTVYMVSKTVGE